MRREGIKKFCHSLYSQQPWTAVLASRVRAFVWTVNWVRLANHCRSPHSFGWYTHTERHMVGRSTLKLTAQETWCQQINYSSHEIHTHGKHTFVRAFDSRRLLRGFILEIEKCSKFRWLYCIMCSCVFMWVYSFVLCAHRTAVDQTVPWCSTIILFRCGCGAYPIFNFVRLRLRPTE